jgi:hypothetical protein
MIEIESKKYVEYGIMKKRAAIGKIIPPPLKIIPACELL